MTATRFAPFAALLLITFVATLPGAAHAEAAQARLNTRSITVVSSDLDLTKPAGQATLRRRVDRAIENVCGTVDSRDLHAAMEYANCRTAALASAGPQIEALVASAVNNHQFAATGEAAPVGH